MNQASGRPLLSIVIPALNEAEALPRCLDALTEPAVRERLQVLVSDGGSTDGTLEAVRSRPGVLLLESPRRGRAAQMNAGAAATSGEWLLFLHADTLLEPKALRALVSVLEGGESSPPDWGAFELDLDAPSHLYRFIAWAANVRARLLQLPLGDQGVFVRRDVFERVGGFPEVPFMEDVELSLRLRQLSTGHLLRGFRVLSSARRWHRLGPLRTTALNVTLLLLRGLGVPPERLEPLYRNPRGEAARLSSPPVPGR